MTKSKLSNNEIIDQTFKNIRKQEHYLEISEKLKDDPDKDQRLNSQQCTTCYYTPCMGGSALTESICRICQSSIVNASTMVDVLCIECARQRNLCVLCGGDINLNLNRKK